jgi:hypothetical protein
MPPREALISRARENKNKAAGSGAPIFAGLLRQIRIAPHVFITPYRDRHRQTGLVDCLAGKMWPYMALARGDISSRLAGQAEKIPSG